MRHVHPANQARHDDRTLGQRLADKCAAGLGSWRFIIIQSLIMVGWVTWNGAAKHPFDGFPFILLNLALSTSAAYAAPLLQLSSNRTAEHDRIKAEHDYCVNEETLRLLRQIHSGEITLCRRIELITGHNPKDVP